MNAQTKKCPICAEEIKAEALICRFCRARFEVRERGYCLTDHAVVDVKDGKCALCGGDAQDVHFGSNLVGGAAPAVPTKSSVPLASQLMPVTISTDRLKRPGCVTAYAILLILGAGLFAFTGLFGNSAFTRYGPLVRELAPPLILIFAVLYIASAIGLWQLKNWARILVMVLTGLSTVSSGFVVISVFIPPSYEVPDYAIGLFLITRGISLILNLIIIGISTTIFSWFRKNGKYFTQELIKASQPIPKPIELVTQARSVPKPDASTENLFSTPEQQEDNITRIKQWCDGQKDKPIKVIVISIFDGRENRVTSAHGKLLAIEEHPISKGMFRVSFDSHLQGRDNDAVMLGYEVTGVKGKGDQLIIYKGPQQRIELSAGVKPPKSETSTVINMEWPEIPGYGFQSCFPCGGEGSKGTCKSCEGHGKILVREPARNCSTCGGNGYLTKQEIYIGPMCTACRGTGWENALKYSEAIESAKKSLPAPPSAKPVVSAKEPAPLPYEFRNHQYYSNKPLTDLEGVILLAPVGEATDVAKSKVFIGTVEDTAGEWFQRVLKQCNIFAIGHPRSRTLFAAAAQGDSGALEDIIETGIDGARKNTGGLFPPAPVNAHDYKVRALASNEKTKSPFLVIAVYRK